MSCPGNNYVVPGANPALGVVTVTGGQGIVISGTSTEPVINTDFEVIAGDRTNITGTATAPVINADAQVMLIGTNAIDTITLPPATVTSLLSITFNLPNPGFMILNGTATLTNNNIADTVVSYLYTLNGVQVSSSFQDSSLLQDKFATVTTTWSTVLPAGTHTILYSCVCNQIFGQVVEAGVRNLNATIVKTYPSTLVVTAPNQSSGPVGFTGNFTFNTITIPPNYIYGDTITVAFNALVTTVAGGPPGTNFAVLNIYAIKDGDPLPLSPNFGQYIFSVNSGALVPLSFNNGVIDITDNRIVIVFSNINNLFGDMTCDLSNIEVVFPVLM
jgi:hypothetical protein